MDKPLWMWGFFFGFVVLLLAFDLGVLHRQSREIKTKESLWLSAFYILISCAFGAWVWATLGHQKGEEYFTGYIIEKTLSLDNIFIMSVVFSYLAIPKQYQHRVLFWGILGVIVLRALLIGLGAFLVTKFAWILYIFALFLMITGAKMLFFKAQEMDLEKNLILKILRKFFRITSQLHDHHFLVKLPHATKAKKVLYVTPLLVCLLLIEFIDLIFAIDSIPAIFAITIDPFIVYTSNIFAILGLRSLYFALSSLASRFQYLDKAIALLLIFIGSKVFLADLWGLEKFPTNISLIVTVIIIAGGIISSLLKSSKTLHKR
jgi:tellurite resistance protein TerC